MVAAAAGGGSMGTRGPGIPIRIGLRPAALRRSQGEALLPAHRQPRRAKLNPGPQPHASGCTRPRSRRPNKLSGRDRGYVCLHNVGGRKFGVPRRRNVEKLA
jgi:hypothetical protein